MMDLVVRNARALVVDRFQDTEIGIADGRIAEIARSISGRAKREIDAAGQLVLPGVVDAHVHFNEPGRADWEGFATGSLALALGGGTSFVDMPLNASPPTIDRASFERKKAAGEASSVLDFALWGGLVPENLDRLEELAECGVVGFKAFMVDSGIADFPGVDARVLHQGMAIAARLNLPVAVHAEDAEIIAARTARIRAAGGRDARAFLDSRPIEAELAAVRVAIDLAGETGCALHVVHLSSPAAVDLIAAARERGLDVTCEVCPHHLLLDERAMTIHGAFAKCAPPLRPAETAAELMGRLRAGRIDCVGSDHSPAPPDMKTSDDMFQNWGGIMGAQHGFLLLLDRLGEDIAGVWKTMAKNPAERFGLGDRKGCIAVGRDADLIFVGRGEPRAITADELRYRHRTSPYVGKNLARRVARSLLRGREILPGTAGQPAGGGKFLPRMS